LETAPSLYTISKTKEMKNHISLIVLFIVISLSAEGQSFKQQFNDLVSKKDTAAQFKLLNKWEATDSNDPELYVAYFNFYVNKSKKDIIKLGDNPNGKDAFQIMDTDTTKKEPVAYMYSDIYYDPYFLNKGFDYADKE
jgi:hypothetical protein